MRVMEWDTIKDRARGRPNMGGHEKKRQWEIEKRAGECQRKMECGSPDSREA